MDKFKKEFKREGDNNDLHGFESAVRSKHAEALEYFWNKLQPVLSKEAKDELLIYTATYYDVFCGRANSDMIAFAMDHLDENKYHELLSKDFAKNKHYSSLSELTSSYLFDRAEKLFKYLSSADIIYDDYSTFIYWVLYNILSVPDDVKFIGSGYQMLKTMWHMDEFEEHKQFFINRLSYGAPAADKIGRLIKSGRTSDILSEIVSALNIQQVKNLNKSTLWAYDIFKSSNLFNDDVIKNLVAIEHASVHTLASQEEMVILGAGSR